MLAWHPHPEVWLLFGASLGAYFFFSSKAPAGAEIPARRKACFVAGIIVFWIGSDWPMHELSEDFLFSAHMVQHTLFSLVAPPLVLLGLPSWMLRGLFPAGPRFQFLKFMTRPMIALLLFNGIVLFTHWPVVVDAALGSELLHFSVHFLLVTSALLMWWVVIDPLPELARLTPPAKMFYLFLQSILPTIPASFLTFAESPMYHFYETVPRIINLSVLADQQLAGLIMKIGGGLLLWLVIATLFFKWHSSEESGEVTDLTWEDFEHDLRAWELRP